jgi:hypothetical protein
MGKRSLFHFKGQSTRIGLDLKMCIATVAIGEILQEKGHICSLMFEG